MERKLALWGVLAALLIGLLTALLIARRGDLASVYEDERDTGSLQSTPDTTSALAGEAGLRDTPPPERIPAAPLVATKSPRTPKPKRSLRLLCSPSAKHLIGDALKKPFEQAHPEIDLVLLEEPDRSCIGNVIMQNTAAAIVGVPLSPNENNRGLVTRVLGYHIVVVITHRDNSLTSLFSNQLNKVLDGRIDNWGELGWQQLQIQTVFESPSHRDDPAARLLRMTDKAAQLAVLLPNGDRIMDYVSRERRALGLVTLAQLESRRGDVRYLEIDTVPPTVANYLRGAYPLGCTFRLVHTRGQQTELVELLSFLRSREGRQLLEQRLTLPYLRSKNR